ncbi:MAG: hypothetical protein M3N08_02725 [Pseudomonadota bacterium]|nr:hypothetical protein [Pseudomonadota bacterium]
MKNWLMILPLLSLLTLANCASTSTVSDGTVIPKETLQPYAGWVQQAMNVDMVSIPITVASGSRLKTSLGLKGVQQARAMAAYLPGQIILNNIAWDPGSLRSQSYLIHEMVHHAQLLSGRHYACDDAKEREAYTLQNRWLVEHGEEPMVSEEFISKISACTVESRSEDPGLS